jgi:hypothetical protein
MKPDRGGSTDRYCRGDLPAAGDTVEFWLDDGTRGELLAVDVTVVPTDSTA